MALQKILIGFTGWEARLQAAAEKNGFNGTICCTDDADEQLRSVADANVLVPGALNAELLAAARKLAFIQAFSGGVEGILFPELVASEVPLACVKPLFATVAGEHALGAMLAFAHRFHHVPDALPMTQWDDGYDEVAGPFDLEGGTVGIVGVGNMGLGIATRARALGMRVLGLARTKRDVPAVDRLYTRAQQDAFLSACDFVVIAVPLTEATAGMVDATFLLQMKPTAYLIDSSGRPRIFDYPALVEAVHSGAIAGASLQPGGVSA